MALKKKRIKALELRKKGRSYSQIKLELGVSKSTLSYWLREYPLSKERIKELRGNNQKRIEKFRETMRKKREGRRGRVFVQEKDSLLPMSERELYIAGLCLYWGEGGKTAEAQLTLSNTDPEMLRFFIKWLMEGLGVKRDQIKARLHIYSDMIEGSELNYWSKALGLRKSQFNKTYIKKNTSKRITYKSRGHGTCNLIVYGRDYYEKVMMGIQVIGGNRFHGLG
jgi:transposase-like protein